MDLHIGSVIKNVATQKRMGTGELAKRIPMTRQNLDKIYRKKSVDSELLVLISQALDFDFFGLYSIKLGKQLTQEDVAGLLGGPEYVPPQKVYTELEKCKIDKAHLEEKYQMQTDNVTNLQKYIKLLEEKLNEGGNGKVEKL